LPQTPTHVKIFNVVRAVYGNAVTPAHISKEMEVLHGENENTVVLV
jgi:hypothetical protein